MDHNVLFIGEDPAVAGVVQEALAGGGDSPFTLEWVSQLSDGLDRLKKDGITAVLLDLSLPDIQGISTFVKLSRAVPNVPILVLGDLGEEDVAKKAVDRGAHDYLLKNCLGSEPRLKGKTTRAAAIRSDAPGNDPLQIFRRCHGIVQSSKEGWAMSKKRCLTSASFFIVLITVLCLLTSCQTANQGSGGGTRANPPTTNEKEDCTPTLTQAPNGLVVWSPNGEQYVVNKQDDSGIYQL
jgi:DNA-binding NarL/FixJ family response regulator